MNDGNAVAAAQSLLSGCFILQVYFTSYRIFKSWSLMSSSRYKKEIWFFIKIEWESIRFLARRIFYWCRAFQMHLHKEKRQTKTKIEDQLVIYIRPKYAFLE